MKRILDKLFIISCIIVSRTMSFKAYSQQSESPPVIPVPKNKGLLIRRTLDYNIPNQKAEIYVSNKVSPYPD